jgi:hypothetical protein
MSDKNLEQWINIKFCVKIVKGASETALLPYGEYAVKKVNVLNGMGSSRKGKKMCKMTQEVGIQKCKGQMQMWTEYGEPWYAQIKD